MKLSAYLNAASITVALFLAGWGMLAVGISQANANEVANARTLFLAAGFVGIVPLLLNTTRGNARLIMLLVVIGLATSYYFRMVVLLFSPDRYSYARFGQLTGQQLDSALLFMLTSIIALWFGLHLAGSSKGLRVQHDQPTQVTGAFIDLDTEWS